MSLDRATDLLEKSTHAAGLRAQAPGLRAGL